MKILCNFAQSGPSYVRSGWARVFQALGHEFRLWDPSRQSAFDAFGEYNPDLWIGTTYEVNRAVVKNIIRRPEMKVILFASAWGPYIKDVDLKKYPIVVASEQEKRTIEELRKTTGKPDFVFIHAHGEWLHGTMSGWWDIGVPYRSLLNASDAFIYLNGKMRPELACDAVFCGGYWGYKARNIDKFILPLCHPKKGLNIKVFGNSVWPVSQYLGTIDDSDVADLFASATVCPNVSEPHSTDYGFDCVERLFKVPSSGGMLVSDYVEEAVAIFGEAVPFCRTAQDMEKTIRHFVAHPEDRLPFMEKARRLVLASHTYFDRVADIFGDLGMNNEVSKTLAMKAKHLEEFQ